MLNLVSWNIGRRDRPWHDLASSEDFDVAILQEAHHPPMELAQRFQIPPKTKWCTQGGGVHRPWRAQVVALSDRVRLRTRSLLSLAEAGPNDLGISRLGTIDVAEVEDVVTGEVLTVASIYSVWERPDKKTGSRWIYADASVHRLISDLSSLVGRQRTERIIVAGDLNILRGYGEDGSPYWKRRYDSVFERMEAIGLPLAGPMLPEGGEPADPRPSELPEGSTTVPTYRHQDRRPATRQLDFVFASRDLHPRLKVLALNREHEWGSSDHCRVKIELSP